MELPYSSHWNDYSSSPSSPSSSYPIQTASLRSSERGGPNGGHAVEIWSPIPVPGHFAPPDIRFPTFPHISQPDPSSFSLSRLADTALRVGRTPSAEEESIPTRKRATSSVDEEVTVREKRHPCSMCHKRSVKIRQDAQTLLIFRRQI